MTASRLLLQVSTHLTLFGSPGTLNISKLRQSGSAVTCLKASHECLSHSSYLSGWMVTVITSENPPVSSCAGTDMVLSIIVETELQDSFYDTAFDEEGGRCLDYGVNKKQAC